MEICHGDPVSSGFGHKEVEGKGKDFFKNLSWVGSGEYMCKVFIQIGPANKMGLG